MAPANRLAKGRDGRKEASYVSSFQSCIRPLGVVAGNAIPAIRRYQTQLLGPGEVHINAERLVLDFQHRAFVQALPLAVPQHLDGPQAAALS